MSDHNKQLKFLKNCFKKKFPHSWIFYGPNGIGKYKFTIEFIKDVNKIKNLGHSLYEINSPDRPALIDDIRELISSIKLTNSSITNQKTFFLIHKIDTLNLNCMNALLKTIEEPPKNSIIIILAQNLRKIPKTILSRCIKLKFNSFDCNFFMQQRELQNQNFIFCNYNPKILKILNNKDGEEIKQKTIFLIRHDYLELNNFYKLYEKISENFFNYFSVVVNIIYFEVKSKITKSFFNSDQTKKALFYLDFIKSISIDDLKIDKKKVLHLIFSKYFKLRLNN